MYTMPFLHCRERFSAIFVVHELAVCPCPQKSRIKFTEHFLFFMENLAKEVQYVNFCLNWPKYLYKMSHAHCEFLLAFDMFGHVWTGNCFLFFMMSHDERCFYKLE